jgi:hypothetical protein
MTLRVAQGDSLTSWATNSFSRALSLWSSWMVSSLLHERAATLHSAQWCVDSLRRDWLSHYRRPMNEWFLRSLDRAQHGLQMTIQHVVSIALGWCQISISSKRWTKTWMRKYKHRYFIALYKADRCKVYGVWSGWVVSGDGWRWCLSAKLPEVKSPSYEPQITNWPESEVTDFTAFLQMYTPRAVSITVRCLQPALVKQITVNRQN